LTVEKAHELINAPVVGDRVLGENPENGKLIVAKDGRYGPYVTELEPEPGAAPAEGTETVPADPDAPAVAAESAEPDAEPVVKSKAKTTKAKTAKAKAAPKPRT